MSVTGLHLLLTYECNLRCAHCFVWGGPAQMGTLRPAMLRRILDQADEAGSIEWIYFEGGEPFLHYGLLLEGIDQARSRGYRVGVVTNAFWAVTPAQARSRLAPLAGEVEDFSISTDRYHGSEPVSREARYALEAAKALDIPADFIRIAQPGEGDPAHGQIPAGESAVVYRGRAASELAAAAPQRAAADFDRCPHEDLRSPGRVHLDPLGHVHLCQGITMGNVREQPLKAIFDSWNPDDHPIVGPLLRGGPFALAQEHGLDIGTRYADACHLCYETRCALRRSYPRTLAPGQMYGEPAGV